MHPAYPTTQDLLFASWLKHFATTLPTYAAKYQIAEVEVQALQHTVASYLHSLGEQVARVSQAIYSLTEPNGGWPPSAVPYPPIMRTLPQQVMDLSYRILSHSAYTSADTCDLGLECPLQPAKSLAYL
ncbi:MAG: hypothetical protein ACRYG7_26290 [Janthinobacterium lividum]